MVVLMSRTPVLERRVGCDVLARWHSAGGRVFLVLVLTHAAAAVQAWATTRQQNLLTAIVGVLALPGLVEATLGTLLFVAIAVISMWGRATACHLRDLARHPSPDLRRHRAVVRP
jgi:hypothetical protein